eukprot:6300168-Alexandrium_andersonii.AAC.1
MAEPPRLDCGTSESGVWSFRAQRASERRRGTPELKCRTPGSGRNSRAWIVEPPGLDCESFRVWLRKPSSFGVRGSGAS